MNRSDSTAGILGTWVTERILALNAPWHPGTRGTQGTQGTQGTLPPQPPDTGGRNATSSPSCRTVVNRA
jgi:hypothetical protein